MIFTFLKILINLKYYAQQKKNLIIFLLILRRFQKLIQMILVVLKSFPQLSKFRNLQNMQNKKVIFMFNLQNKMFNKSKIVRLISFFVTLGIEVYKLLLIKKKKIEFSKFYD